MHIYLIRNAPAQPAEGDLEDAARPLSPSGRRISRDVGILLGRQGVELDALLTSPLVRAVQTAELIAGALGYLGVVEVLGALAPGYRPELVLRALGSRGPRIAIVGHEPGLSALGAVLAQRPAFPPLRRGQVSYLERGEPRWYIHPETLAVDRLLLA